VSSAGKSEASSAYDQLPAASEASFQTSVALEKSVPFQ
jgi:hypothetical protein